MTKKSNKIANRLRAIRAAKGLSQADVADAIGRTQATVCTWEKYGCLNFLDAVKLADYYGVTLDELSGREPVDL